MKKYLNQLINCALCLLLLGSAAIKAQDTVGTLQIDTIATDSILRSTTDQNFLTRWVDVLPDHPTVPSPRDVLGYTIGTPGELTQVDDIYRYFEALAAASDRVEIFQLGQTFEERDMLLVAIAEPEFLTDIDTYKSYLNQLSDPRVTDRAKAEEIIEDALPIFWMTAGLHSPELGPPEMVMELAYRLAVETREPFASIRENVITLITPVFDVDGRTRQVEWYKRNIKGHTDHNDMPPRSVPFWGHYTYHDNNRDGISISQPITQNYVNGVYEWKPTVSLDLHESVPLLYVAGGTGPYNEGVSPITISEWQMMANYEISRLTGLGLEGVWTWGYYTGWYPGYMLWATNNHNGMGRFYETFGNGSADTMERDIGNVRFAGKDVTSRQWYRAAPPPKKMTWSMRNNTNYMQSGVLASLEMVAKNGKMFLSNYYQKGVDALEQGAEEAPYAYLIPQQQTDPDSANYMVAALGRHAIEIQQVTADGEYGDVEIKRGDLLVKLNQPYGPLAKTLFENQDFPKDVEVPPYDDVSWTFGLVYGVDVEAIDDEDVLLHVADSFNQDEAFLSSTDLPRGNGIWVIPNNGQRELGPARFALGDMTVLVAEEEFEVGRDSYPAGSLLLDMNELDRDRVSAVLSETNLVVENLRRMPDVATHELDLPRLGVYQSWRSTQNAGWVRYSLDQAEIPYTLFSKDKARAGSLLEEFDVILIPHMSGGTTLAAIIGGVDPKWSPLPYTNTAATPSHGHILSSEDITGGLGFEGMAAFDEFVRGGGTLVTLGSAGVIATDSGILRGVNKRSTAGMNTPGSIMTAKITDHSSPLVYGYDEITHVFKGNSPIFSVADYNRQYSPLQFGVKEYDEDESEDEANDSDDEESTPKPPLVISGGIVQGADRIDGQPAIVSKSLDDGHIVLFSWNPMHRHVNHHDHAFVYNAILNWNDL
ncbi:MAG: peptidase [SAR86 cluster bacterium]|uniref:Peptidase n=1 Tax=SAR86 cluster bacterium TaxID=2030880 RepID=A0A2A5B7J4_9GAMM|nr:MAG: peptidase [SAR86 cluster bacterium]